MQVQKIDPDHNKSHGNTYKEITMIYDILNTLPTKRVTLHSYILELHMQQVSQAPSPLLPL
jgi:hypothetical protein